MTDRTSLLLGAGEGEVIEARGNQILIKAASPSQLICDYTAPPHFPGPPLHVHPGFDESFLVVAGTLEVQVRRQVSRLSPGDTAYVSGGTPHTFSNPGAEPVRFILVCSPGGWEHFFRAVAAGDSATIAAVSERFGYAETPVGEPSLAGAAGR
jgi:mannose-6-phosphate isomerase-like protein (cupin superfamily)